MATTTLTPLSNGIVLGVGELVVGMCQLSGYAPDMVTVISSNLYYTNQGNVYFQGEAGTTATLLLAAGFEIKCGMAIWITGVETTVWLGGVGGQYVSGGVLLDGTVSTAIVSTDTLATATQAGAGDFTAITLDYMMYPNIAIVGTSTGKIYSVDITVLPMTLALEKTLTATSLPGGSTFVISHIECLLEAVYTRYLVCGTASANDLASTSNYSELIHASLDYGSFDTLGAVTWSGYVVTENAHLGKGSIGVLPNPAVLPTDSTPIRFIPKYVAAGYIGGTSPALAVYESNDAISWVKTPLVDQASPAFSLVFNQWVFVLGLQYGMVLISTDGVSWFDVTPAALALAGSNVIFVGIQG